MCSSDLQAAAIQQADQQAVNTASSAPETSTGKAHGGSVNNVIDDIIAYLHHIRR